MGSHPPEEVSTKILADTKSEEQLNRSYKGCGTTAVCALWDYTRKTKQWKFKLQEQEVMGMIAVCMIDNPGGWKSLAKAGMLPIDVDAIDSYGPEIRFQTQKLIR